MGVKTNFDRSFWPRMGADNFGLGAKDRVLFLVLLAPAEGQWFYFSPVVSCRAGANLEPLAWTFVDGIPGDRVEIAELLDAVPCFDDKSGFEEKIG